MDANMERSIEEAQQSQVITADLATSSHDAVDAVDAVDVVDVVDAIAVPDATKEDLTKEDTSEDEEEVVRRTVANEPVPASEFTLTGALNSLNPFTSLEEVSSPRFTPAPWNVSRIVLSTPDADYTFFINNPVSLTEHILGLLTFLREHDTSNSPYLAGELEGGSGSQTIFDAWQEDPVIQNFVRSMETMQGTIPLGLRSSFARRHDRKFLRLKKGQRASDLRALRVGFDPRIFALSHRVSTHGDPILCPYLLRGTRSDWDSFNSESNTFHRRSITSTELQVLRPSDSVVPVSPGFDRLATAFFNGDGVPEDLDTLPNPSLNSGVNYKIAHYGSGWTKIVNARLMDDSTLAVFLQDVIMANELEKACASDRVYAGLKVFRDRQYYRVVESMKVEALSDSLDDDIDGSRAGSPGLQAIIMQGLARDAELLTSELSDLTKSDTSAAGPTSRSKRSRSKKKKATGSKKHKAMPEKPLEDDANHDDEMIAARLDAELNGLYRLSGASQAEPSKTVTTTPANDLGLGGAPVIFDRHGGSGQGTQLEGGDTGWTTVAPKSSFRSKSLGHKGSQSSRQKGSQRSSANPSGNLDRDLKYHKKAANKNGNPSQQVKESSNQPRNRSSSGMPAAASVQATGFLPLTKAHQSPKTKDNTPKKGDAPANMRVFDIEQYPSIPSQCGTPSEDHNNTNPGISVAAKPSKVQVSQPNKPSVSLLDQVEHQVVDGAERQVENCHSSVVSSKALSPASNASSAAPETTLPVSEATLPAVEAASSVSNTTLPVSKAPTESSILSTLIKPALGTELGLRLTKSDSELAGYSETGSNGLGNESEGDDNSPAVNLDTGSSGQVGEIDGDDGQQTFSIPPQQPAGSNMEGVASNHLNSPAISTGVEHINHQHDPPYGTTTGNGGLGTSAYNPVYVPTPDFNIGHIPAGFPCSFCRIICIPSLEAPFLLCPGCGFDCNIRYCSAACLLVDAYHHSRVCINIPASMRTHTSVIPNGYIYDYNPPFQLDGHPSESPEKFRQRAFSMFCHAGPFPPLFEAWARATYSQVNLLGVNSLDILKITGDYHVFRSDATAIAPRQNPVADVIFTIKLRVGDPLKAILNRTMNACFLTYHVSVTMFLFRILYSLILDAELFEMTPHQEGQATILNEFRRQFSKEFACDPSNFKESTPFDFDNEWPQIAHTLLDIETRNPLICQWIKYRCPWVHWQNRP